ncbi:NAD-dependent succinate-semialdehyde dehydrogenase [Corynebacterium sp.]|uniref:NAD-dependent succinate-semialdehyde dehydrogenase n=1 Tax=Corynebacterium sp. TaxID=1720 RepID=UPI0026DBB9A1|nr:NAD-dependent succinate-semialdehyde dehydrogenase [Corynebacterium sp.]MDO5076305.1 NAD-dependent succinate-semialdehyde dehydrogenase [Corynebacterium sp.]
MVDPSQIHSLIASTPKDLFLAGRWSAASDGGTLEVQNPATGDTLAQVASASSEDAQAALRAALDVQKDWANTPARERSEILYRTFELIHAHAEDLALLQTLELGRALPDSRAEVSYGAEFFRWFAEEAVRIRGDYRLNPAGTARILVRQEPVGPVLAITPWNFPLAMGTRKLGPALAAGCTVIVKPASKTPLTMLYLARLLKEAGLPDGVVSVLPSARASRISALLDAPGIRKLTFTGSSTVGQKLAMKAAKHSLRVSLEMGGNAPYIVLPGADVDLAAREIAVAKMRGAGQVCIAANRFLIHSSVAEEFVQKVAAEMASFKLGPGWEEGVTFGPLSGADQVETVRTLVDDAVARGARLIWAGPTPQFGPEFEGGAWYPGAVLMSAPDSSPIHRDEIFGPVVSVTTFDDVDQAIARANSSPFGLAAYVFGPPNTALKVAESLEVGMVAINRGALSDPAAPFGGVKESGLGREGGFEGIHEFLEPKFIALPLDE